MVHPGHQSASVDHAGASFPVPGCGIEYAPSGGPDKRSYRITCDRIYRVLPGFQPQWTAREGAQELYDAYRVAGLTVEDLEGVRHVRISYIQRQLKGGDWTILSAGQIVEVFSPQVNITGPASRRATRSSALHNVSKSCIYCHLRALIRWHSPVFRRQPNCDTAQRRKGVPRSLMAVASLATGNPSQDKASIFGTHAIPPRL